MLALTGRVFLKTGLFSTQLFLVAILVDRLRILAIWDSPTMVGVFSALIRTWETCWVIVSPPFLFVLGALGAFAWLGATCNASWGPVSSSFSVSFKVSISPWVASKDTCEVTKNWLMESLLRKYKYFSKRLKIPNTPDTTRSDTELITLHTDLPLPQPIGIWALIVPSSDVWFLP